MRHAGWGPLDRGREAWSQGESDVAETLKDAIRIGGLHRKDTLDAYVFRATRLI
jgi:hypothetical protein